MRDVEKSGLINDAFNLARGGYLSYDLALGLTRFLNKERGHLPWESAYSVLSYITHMFELGGDYSNMRVCYIILAYIFKDKAKLYMLHTLILIYCLIFV